MPNTVALSHQILRIWPAFDLTERSSTAQCSAVGRWQIELAGRRELLATGLGDKLVVAPLLILVVCAGLIHLRGRTTEITLFEAGDAAADRRLDRRHPIRPRSRSWWASAPLLRFVRRLSGCGLSSFYEPWRL